MALAELLRPRVSIGSYPSVRSNRELRQILEEQKIDTVYLFRAGLIINRALIESGVDLLNIHCADVPEYAGLAALARALEDGALEQNAVMHRVTESIDGGEVLDREPYTLDAKRWYFQNEMTAYKAGIRLLFRQLNKEET